MTKAATLEKKKAIGANGSKYPITKYPMIWNNSALTRAAINEAIKRHLINRCAINETRTVITKKTAIGKIDRISFWSVRYAFRVFLPSSISFQNSRVLPRA